MIDENSRNRRGQRTAFGARCRVLLQGLGMWVGNKAVGNLYVTCVTIRSQPLLQKAGEETALIPNFAR